MKQCSTVDLCEYGDKMTGVVTRGIASVKQLDQLNECQLHSKICVINAPFEGNQERYYNLKCGTVESG
jgi:hypothetical protein